MFRTCVRESEAAGREQSGCPTPKHLHRLLYRPIAQQQSRTKGSYEANETSIPVCGSFGTSAVHKALSRGRRFDSLSPTDAQTQTIAAF
ncbi:unnamed protein product [Gadus morhua 'NCC']